MRVPSLEASYADHRQRVHQGRLGGVLLGHGQVANPRGAQAARDRQHAGHRRTEPSRASWPMNP